MTEKTLSRRKHRGFTILHVEEDGFRGATPRNKTGWSKKRYWVVPAFEWDERTLREAKAYIDRRLELHGPQNPDVCSALMWEQTHGL